MTTHNHNVAEMPAYIVNTLRSRGMSDAEISHLSPKTIFSHFCEWNGIIGWHDTLWHAVEQLQALQPTTFKGKD